MKSKLNMKWLCNSTKNSNEEGEKCVWKEFKIIDTFENISGDDDDDDEGDFDQQITTQIR